MSRATLLAASGAKAARGRTRAVGRTLRCSFQALARHHRFVATTAAAKASPHPTAKLGSKQVRAIADYVIAGAGSAGCVLARRLTDAGYSVCLVEAGREDTGRPDSWTIHMPSALTYSVADDRYNWDFYSEPQDGLGGEFLPRAEGGWL